MAPNVNVDVEYSDAGYDGNVYDGVSELEARSVKLHGEVTDLGEANSAICYFEYIDASAGESFASNAKQVPETPFEITEDSNTGTESNAEFNYNLTGLKPANLYKFRAVAEGQ